MYWKPIPWIRYLLMISFKPENSEKIWRISIRFLTESLSPRKNVELFAYAVNKKQWSKTSIPSLTFWLFIKAKKTSKAILNRYADIWSPRPVPFSDLKYCVAVPYLKQMVLEYLIMVLPILWNYLQATFFQNTYEKIMI